MCNIEGFTVSNRPDVLVIVYTVEDNIRDFKLLKCLLIKLNYWEGGPRVRQNATMNARRSWFVEQITGDEELAKIYRG